MNKRIELGETDYAIVYPELLHGTQQKLMDIFYRAVPMPKELVPLSGIDEQQLAKDFQIDVAMLKTTSAERQHTMLLNQVVEWSFGDVTQEAIDRMPERIYQKLWTEVDRLYSEAPFTV